MIFCGDVFLELFCGNNGDILCKSIFEFFFVCCGERLVNKYICWRVEFFCKSGFELCDILSYLVEFDVGEGGGIDSYGG